MGDEADVRWRLLQSEILDVLDGREPIAHVPGCAPTTVKAALDRAALQVYGGQCVGHLFEQSETGTTLWLKDWRHDAAELTWASVKLLYGTQPP